MASTATGLDSGDTGRTLEDAFAREARRGVALAAIARTVAFALLWVSYFEDALGNWENPQFVYRSGLIAAALVSGGLTLLAARRSKRPVSWCGVFLALDLAVITLLIFGWLPEMIADYPQFLAVRMQDILLFLVILGASALPLSPRLVAGAGIGTAVIWVAAVLHSFWNTPGAMTSDAAARGAKDQADLLARISKALVLDTDYFVVQTALVLAIAGLLAIGVREGRRLVVQAVRAEAGRARFARFMPPGVLDALGARGDGTLPSRRSAACILFADLDRSATPSVEALGRFYAMAEPAVFEEGGVIDRFVGDPVMATFGAIEGGQGNPADRALRCAERLVAEGAQIAAIHFGPVISGEVGSDRQRAFGVVGDTVNSTRRLLDWGRERGLALIVSGAAADALTAEARADLAPQGEASLRGLDTPVTTWSRA